MKQTIELTNAKAEIAKLTKTVNENEEGRKEMETKLLYLEAYSRREDIKFMNIAVDSTEEREDAKETSRSFLERDLALLDARTVEIQRVHRSGKGKDGGPRPILVRFPRYKDVQKIIIFTWAPFKRYGLPNVPWLSCRNCQATQGADENFQRSQKKTEFRQLSVNLNQISYILEDDYGQ